MADSGHNSSGMRAPLAYYGVQLTQILTQLTPIVKTFNSLLAVTAITLLLAAATVLRAGPPPDLSNRMRVSVKPATPAQVVACNEVGKVCTNCQTCAGCSVKAGSRANS